MSTKPVTSLFVVEKSPNGLPSISCRLEKKYARKLKSIISNPYSDTEEYKKKLVPSPFLQGNWPDGKYVDILIEFWGSGVSEYVSYLNQKIFNEPCEKYWAE